MMPHGPRDGARRFLVLCAIVLPIGASLPEPQREPARLPDAKFNYKEYSEYPDGEDHGPQVPKWSQVPHRGVQLGDLYLAATGSPIQYSTKLDPNIEWDSTWASELKLGQVSAVSIDPRGNVAICHRGDRVWNFGTFDNNDRFDSANGPIAQHTVILLDKAGKRIARWGAGMFYLPHGLTVDSLGNYWLTDVAMHQVFKFDAKDIEDNWRSAENFVPRATQDAARDRGSFEGSFIKPSLILGEAFEPGNDEKTFCKPTAVAVDKNGDFFVSDGYCNSRIIKFNSAGERILQWGRRWGMQNFHYQTPPPNAFFVPHALALAEDLNYVFIADREDGRVQCFHANNGTFRRDYRHPAVGTKIYSVAYARERLYLVNGPDPFATNGARTRGFVLDVHSGALLSQFAPGKDLDHPHDIAVTEDGREIYVAELDADKIYRFLQGVNSTKPEAARAENGTASRQDATTSSDVASGRQLGDGATATTLIVSLMTAAVVLIGLCVAVAAIMARCQKRGCLLTVRRRMRWEAERRENFKLSNFLESRKGKGFKFLDKRPNPRDFSKLNTEPETSEDEHPENSLTKII